MADTKGVWFAKTLGLVVLAAVGTAVLATLIQQLIWDKSFPGVSSGAAIGVAVTIAMARRKQVEAPK